MVNVYIQSDKLKNGINKTFESLNQYGMDLISYLLSDGCVPLDKVYFDGIKFTKYELDDISDNFLSFINLFRDDIKFEGLDLGWVKNLSENELDTTIPKNFKNSDGRTFREYFADLKEINGIKYGSTYSYSNGYNRTDLPNETDFWDFYDYFGQSRITLQKL